MTALDTQKAAVDVQLAEAQARHVALEAASNSAAADAASMNEQLQAQLAALKERADAFVKEAESSSCYQQELEGMLLALKTISLSNSCAR